MATRQFTLCLDGDSATRIERLVKPFGGSVAGYAAQLAKPMSMLPIEDQDEIRQLIETKIKRLARSQSTTSEPAVP